MFIRKRMVRLRVHVLMEHKGDHTGDARKRALLDQFEHWLLPASIVLLGLALSFLWYVSSEWHVSRRASPQTQFATMNDLPSQPLPTAKRPAWPLRRGSDCRELASNPTPPLRSRSDRVQSSIKVECVRRLALPIIGLAAEGQLPSRPLGATARHGAGGRRLL